MKLTQFEIIEIMNGQVRETTEFFVKEGWVPEGWVPLVRIDFLKYRTTSWGGRKGWSFVSLEEHGFLKDEVNSFIEYKRFQKDPEIGNVVDDKVRAIRTMVIHEMAHAAQYATNDIGKKLGIPMESQRKGHKLLWQTIYRLTRRALVNPKETPQIVAVAKRVSKKALKPFVSPKAPLKRREAYREIARLAYRGRNRVEIIDHLNEVHGMKKTTAAVYVSQSGPNAGKRRAMKAAAAMSEGDK